MSTDAPDIDMQDEYDFSQAKQGPIVPPRPHSTEIRLRIDNDLLDWCRVQMHTQGGGDYEELINDAIRLYREYAERIQSHTRGA